MVTIFGKTWDLHQAGPGYYEENLVLISRPCAT